jgi:hypothetical protein
MVNPYFSYRPYLGTVQKLVLQRNPPCTCPVHQPLLYSDNSCGNTHLQVQQHVDSTEQDLGPKIVQNSAYPALHLVQAAIEYFSKPEDQMNSVQKEATGYFRSVDLSRFGWQDGPKALGAGHIHQMLECFNRIFFFGEVKIDFRWGDIAEECLLGEYTDNSKIELHPSFCGYDIGPKDYDGRKFSRLGTLLHETVHAFLYQLACPDCPTNDENTQHADGHSRAYQMLAPALEDATERLFSQRLPVGGFEDFQENWSEVKYLPSLHDLELWRS